ncbi:MAG: hypothetical protein IRZ18_02865 [Clostridia bacterium]|nr:hypothetical protein [Clostridia bacterium]
MAGDIPMAWAAWIVAAAASAAGAAWSVRAFPRRGWVARNYRGQAIPLGAGWAFVAAGMLGGWLVGAWRTTPSWTWWAGPLVLAVLGWLDDRWGSASEKGLRGHLRALLRGRVTTGVWKLAGGGAFALVAAAAVHPPHGAGGTAAWLADALLVALSINGLNAFDLRPGRAVKAWLVLVGAAWLLGTRSAWLPPYLAAVLGFAAWDLRARAMMGDTGSNALGVLAGLSWLGVPDRAARLTMLVLLALFHVWIERRSLTAWIESHPWIRWLDRLGRPADR